MSGFMAAGQARADVDWLVNISDAGFEGTPAGGTVSYAISVSNNGSDLSSPTTITLDVPAGTTFTGATGTITGCTPTPATGPTAVVCNVPALLTAETATLVADIQTTVSGSVSLRASVPTAGDSDTGNNEATEPTTIVSGADISLALSGPATASSGAVIPYTFTATNIGPDAATNVVLQFPVPAGISNVTAPAGCTLTGSTYSCTIAGPIPSGGSVDVDFTGQISSASSSTITAIGSVSGGSPADPISGNNGATLNTTVTSGSDLAIGKARSPGGPLLIGDAATFTLSPSYTGDSPNGITVTDTIPANYTIGTVTAPGWTCTVTGQVLECTSTSGSGAGANVSLGNITIDTTVVSAGSPTNEATITAAGPADPNPGNNTANDGGATISAPEIDLQANKTGPVPALVVVGNSYSFDISTSNVGNADFFGTIEMTDTLPAGLEVTSYGLNGWTCTPAATVVGPQAILCSRVYTAAAPLTAGSTTPVVTLTATVTSPGPIANALHVESPDGNLPDNNAPNDDIIYSVTGSIPGNSADISVVKTATLASLPAGDVQTFAIEVTNTGPATALNVTMTDNLTDLINASVGPTGSGYISESIALNSASGISCGTAASGGTSRLLTCTVASLPVCVAGSTCPVITVTVRPGGDAGARTNTANVLSDTTADANLGNNAGSAPYSIQARADVTVSKEASPDPAIAGQNLTYIISAQNEANGLSAADAVTITDTLPANVTFISASPSSGACATTPTAGSTTGPGNNSIVCNLGTIPNGAQQTVTVVVRPNLVTRSTTLRNDVAITTTTTETNTGNNADFTLTPVGAPVTDLVVNKDETVDPLAVGEDTVYLITVTNLGPSAAENVVVTDTMPPTRISYRSHVVPADGSCSTVPAVDSLGGTLTCSFPLLAEGESRVIQVTGRGVAKGTGINNVSVASTETGLGFESNTLNNSAEERTSVRTRADVQVASKVATPATVNLRDTFTFLITVRNNAGAGLAEADDTLVTDTLPAGMELTGTPTFAVTAGTTTGTTCTGAAGGTSFTCDLGTFSSGGVGEITVPVRVVTLSSNGQTFTNSATISTSSIEQITDNNTSSGPVVVNASSIAGTVFRDFANDAAVNGSDTGISGVTMTLTGTAFDGTPITRTATTDSNGNYTFGLLPAGNYGIAQGAISESYLTNGTTTAGTSLGTVAPTAITAIPLAAATNATGYLFPKVPQARVSIAKAVQTAPAFNSDGSFNVTFRLNVRNLSLEGLTDVEVTDTLAGAAPLFGTYTAATPTLPGTYTMAAAPSGSCSGLNAGFTGAADTVAATGFTLAADATCTIDLQLRVMASNPLPPLLAGGNRYLNQAAVDATGALSGQTSATNPQLTDLSDNGANTDANGNGQGNEAGENDPTPLPLTLTPSIRLEKSLAGVADTNGDGLRNAGDTATYSFVVTNTGPTALTNVVVTDPLVTMSGSAISLAIGASDSTTFTASYVITQADVDRGYLDNSATVDGNAVASDGSPLLDDSGNAVTVTDISDTGTAPDGTAVGAPATTETPDGAGGTDADPTNDPTSLLLGPDPRIDLVKRLVSVVDTTGDGQIGAGDTANYAFAVTNTGNVALAGVTVSDPLVTVSGGPVALAIGATDSTTFTAAYVLVQADIDRGYVENTATATGNAVTSTGTPILDGSGNPVTTTDTSDTGTNPDGSPVPTPATTETPDGAGGTDADPTNDPTVALIAPSPRVVLEKRLVSVADTNADGLRNAGDTATYGFTVTNTGTTALIGVTVTDPLVTMAGGPIALLAVGASDTTTFSATYVITQADVDLGHFDNTASVTGDAATTGGTPILDAGGNPVTTTDISDTGTAPDGTAVGAPATTETPDGAGGTDADPTNDPTSLLLGPQPGIRLVKRLVGSTDVNANGFVDLGDILNYAFDVTNTGNVALADVTVADPLVAVAGGPISLAVGETNSTAFTARYTLTPADVARTYVENTATTSGAAVTTSGTPILDGSGNPVTTTDSSDTGTNPDGSPVTNPEGTETPDGGGATDGDPTNDPTVVPVGRPEIQLDIQIADIIDTNGNGIIDAGDNVVYTFTVTNTGDVNLSDVNMDYTSLSLPLTGLVCTPISLAVGETQTLVCTGNTYTITPADVTAGTVTLTGTATGASSAGVVVSDDDAVVSPTFGLGGLTITKVVDRGQVNPGDVVTYTITVTNTSTTQTTVTNVVDVLPAGFVYQSGTATVAGAASEPSLAGRTLTWAGVSLAPGASAAVVLEVLVSASAAPGNHDNVARAVSPLTGLPVTADAIATVRIAADPVFACSTVIGRVFDDLNQDGYYNGEPKEDRAAITDQTYRSEKWGKPEEPQREKGLPGVRLVAPNGLAITTDEHGRFSVPCAALPADIGSNFMLKVDTRTLPSGYRLTTENPRVVRVTPGMLTKMNFGATVSRVVGIDLSGAAFGTGDNSRKPRAELVDGLKALVGQIADTPSVLRISYQLGKGESEKLAKQRMREVERILNKLWPANGRYQLNVETVIQRRATKAVNE